MKKQSTLIKKLLFETINEMSNDLTMFVKDPHVNFTRNRKLNFDTMIKIILSMGGNTIDKELLEFFDYEINMPTSSAFIQQRDKILPFPFEYLFKKFTQKTQAKKRILGYRLLAIDGSSIAISHNPNCEETHMKATARRRGFNLLHLNAMYDLLNNIYVDAIIQPKMKLNERKALTQMVDECNINSKAIIICDRGYESYAVCQ